MIRARYAALAAFLTLAAVLGLGGCPSANDEASVRKRERAEMEGRLGATKVTLYRVAKTSVRALPPRAAVRALASDKTELTRDEWAALLEKDPALAPHRKRVGMFVAGAHLREAATAGLVLGAAILAARGGGHLAGPGPEEPAWQLPRTAHPFGGSPATFYAECKDILGDDEDRYPTLCVSLMPGPLAAAALAKQDPFATSPFDRLTVSAFEHLVLAGAWFAIQPDLALYELARAKPEDLAGYEEAVLRGGRAALYMKSKWHYQALDELAALEARIPALAHDGAGASGDAVKAAEVEALLKGLLHVLRAQNYLALERKEDADKEFKLSEEALKGGGEAQRLRAGGHLLAAKRLLDDHKFKAAAGEVRAAADAVPGDAKMQAELRQLAAEIEKELPDSTAPLDLVRFAGRLLLREAQRLAVSDDVSRFADDVRARTGEQVATWEKSFPSTDELKDRAAGLWRDLKPR